MKGRNYILLNIITLLFLIFSQLYSLNASEKKDFISGEITKGKLEIEFPLELMGQDFLMASTITSTSDNGFGIAGSKPSNPIHVVFTLENGYVALRLANDSNGLTTSGSTLSHNSSAIFRLFKIKKYSDDSTSVTIDATDLFLSHHEKLSPIDKYGKNTLSGTHKISNSFKKDRSYIESVKSFDDNICVKSVLSYELSVDGRSGDQWKNKPFTTSVTTTLLLLPQNPAKPRITDSRIAIFPTEKVVYNHKGQAARTIHYANLWDLSDGKEIIFYIDNNFPASWQPYIKEGVEQWNELFNELGYSNIIKALPFPTAEDDSKFDPDNLKYSCIRYAPITIQNAMGPSWIDPRNGRILNASVYVYHDMIELVNNWLFIQTSQVDKRVRSGVIPEDVIGDAIRYVISHEVGHCLGFMHNMSASAMVPVDSLRSATYTQKYGTTTSIMDYTRFNYVAQPEDSLKGLKLTPPRFGEYDKFLVKWGYSMFPKETTPEEDYKTSSQWLTEAYKSPLYRYGKQQFTSIVDPRCQTEDLSDNAIIASKYGISNLKYILSHLDNWTSNYDPDFYYRKSISNGILEQYSRYIGHVSAYVGGIETYEFYQGDTHQRVIPVSAEYQKEALLFLLSQLDDLKWIDSTEKYFTKARTKSWSTLLREHIMATLMTLPERSALCSAKAEDLGYIQFTPKECLATIYNKIWSPLASGQNISTDDIIQMDIFLESLTKGLGMKLSLTNGDKKLNEGYNENATLFFEVKPLMWGSYDMLQKIEKLLKKGAKSRDTLTKAYCSYTLSKLESTQFNTSK